MKKKTNRKQNTVNARNEARDINEARKTTPSTHTPGKKSGTIPNTSQPVRPITTTSPDALSSAPIPGPETFAVPEPVSVPAQEPAPVPTPKAAPPHPDGTNSSFIAPSSGMSAVDLPHPDDAITEELIASFAQNLRLAEKSAATIEKYTHAVRTFAHFLAGAAPTKERLLSYRAHLQESLSPQSVNGYLTAIHAFADFCGRDDLRVKSLKVQRRPFLEEDRELTRDEYERLVAAARAAGRGRLALVMETICSTGIRVSELRFFTVEALRAGRILINLKGKNRTILMPKELKKKLLAYVRDQNLTEGAIFRSRNGNPLNRSNIVHEMKLVCEAAGVDPHKVFPHNLRHLFARLYYSVEHNIAHLADILGHSRIETTRIYVAVTASEHEKILDRLRLVS